MEKMTICRLCVDQCLINVKTDKDNHIFAERVKPPYLKENISCPKLKAVNEIIYSSKRLTDPLLKINKSGENIWEKQSWEKALDFI